MSDMAVIVVIEKRLILSELAPKCTCADAQKITPYELMGKPD